MAYCSPMTQHQIFISLCKFEWKISFVLFQVYEVVKHCKCSVMIYFSTVLSSTNMKGKNELMFTTFRTCTGFVVVWVHVVGTVAPGIQEIHSSPMKHLLLSFSHLSGVENTAFWNGGGRKQIIPPSTMRSKLLVRPWPWKISFWKNCNNCSLSG